MDNTDYSLDSLIDRLYSTLNKNNIVNKNAKLSIDRPNVAFANKKTYFQNFTSICKSLNRNVLDVQKFYDDELSTKSSIDSNGILIIDGIFKGKGITNVLKSYLTHYVICKECNSSDTSLKKQNRILFLVCAKCLSEKAL